MNIEDLCTKMTILRGNNFLTMLEQTHSQFYANWIHQLMRMDAERISIGPEEVSNNQTYLYNSLPLEQAEKACKNMYTYELAKITIQISDPVVMTVQKRVSSTFSERLGVVGRAKNNCRALEYFKYRSLSGGTIGLFTGMSIISMIEALYWIIKVDRFIDN